MKRKVIIGFGMLIVGLALAGFPFFWFTAPGFAAPAAQYTNFPTPTPGPDGRIVYIAQGNDSAWRIAAIFGIELARLRELNKWGENPVIQPGDEVILGFAGPAATTPTLGPSPTITPLFPTETAQPGQGTLCIILYNDTNGDSERQEEEVSIPGGAISISNRSGSVSKGENTVEGLDPQCFEELPEGEYNVSVGVPVGYNPTTATNRSIGIKAGDITYIPFGAQANTQTLVEAPTPEGSGKSPLLAIVGGLLLASGLALGLLAGRLVGRNSPKKSK
jgi:hypothetical protein